MTRRSASFLLSFSLILLAGLVQPGPALPASSGAVVAPPALEPATTGGIAAVERALAKLSTHKRVLVIAAHPDDEDTSLLTLVSRGMGGEAAYLALSRGEGGQNLIGPELGIGLGLIRSRELLAARQLDGGRQFFTRAYDFGYTLSVEETLQKWPREALLEDAVRVIRRFKPQVIVSVFPGVPHRNHGQHQAAGVTAYAAFPVAGDPNALPQLRAEGLAPWAPKVLFRSARFDPDAKAITLPIGQIDPLTGRSTRQIAMQSRSQHRSQDMGLLQELGPEATAVTWVAGGAGEGSTDLFQGIDTRLAAIAETIPDAERRRHAGEHLEAVQVVAERTRGALDPSHLSDAVPGLVEIVKHLRAVHNFLTDGGRPEERPAVELIAEKLDVAEAGLAAAAGIAADAFTARETVNRGETFPVQASLWNAGGAPVDGATVALVPGPDWPGEPLKGESKDLAAGALGSWTLQQAVPADAPPTIPYFLRQPLNGSLYDWTDAPAAVKGEPFGPPPLTAVFSFTIDGVPVELEREVVHRHRDQALGEIRRPLRVVPAVEVAVAENLLIWPTASREPRRLQVELTSRSQQPLKGRVEAAVPASWPAVPPRPFELRADGDQAAVEVTLAAPAGLAPGRYPVRLSAVLDNGERFDLAAPVLDYPHIRPTPLPATSTVTVSAADLKLPKLRRVGYVRGASDRVPEYLRQAGIPLEVLDARTLTEGDLRPFDAIVVGSRAYETDPALGQANARLLDYARAGGLLIVQYQQYPFIDGKFAPFPLEIARPHDRVTDETAAVKVLDPASPVFTTPNKIAASDWEGWIQERGLYFAHTWDPAYTPLLAMADPGGPELQGSLLVAKLGQGHYVYTGLALFRQIPAGVPGAFRLFANLLALHEAPRAK
jgi:LmbE family N-acetylglucosaminyl deacetylase